MLSSGERHPQNSIAIVCALHQLPALALLLHTSQVWLVGHGLPARSSAASSVWVGRAAVPTPARSDLHTAVRDAGASRYDVTTVFAFMEIIYGSNVYDT